MLAIKIAERDRGDEELRAVRILASVGHGQETRTGVLVFKVLVFEAFAVDGFTASAVTLGEVTTLKHELVDNTVEMRIEISESLLTSAKSPEILGGLGCLVVEIEFDTAPLFILKLVL